MEHFDTLLNEKKDKAKKEKRSLLSLGKFGVLLGFSLGKLVFILGFVGVKFLLKFSYLL